MTRLEKTVAIIAMLLFAFSLISQTLNQGMGFPDNGLCTPLVKQAGICSDNGVMAAYDHNGVLVHLPAQGDRGLPGVAATIAIGVVATGAPGSNASVSNSGDKSNAVLNFSIPAGLNGKDAVFPQAVVLTCPPASGSVPKGFTATCTLSLP